jgi:Pyridoxamine 5'-phosphate oxidase
MARTYDAIDAKLAAWIAQQKLFFVATAPERGGHVNLSPKAPIETLRLLDARTIEYDDHVGSGAETAAHVRENGRVCVMLCAFDGPPRVVRLHGRGEVLPVPDPGERGVRAVIRVTLDRISDACGYGVPLMEFVGIRPQRDLWLARRGPDAVRDYVRERNAASIDGLPAFDGDGRSLGDGFAARDGGGARDHAGEREHPQHP